MLRGATRGYRNHPQLTRFRETGRPVACLDTYLAIVCDEADRRGYAFDRSKLGRRRVGVKVAATRDQLDFEWTHLRRKMRSRARPSAATVRSTSPSVHPLFRLVPGPVATWEHGHLV